MKKPYHILFQPYIIEVKNDMPKPIIKYPLKSWMMMKEDLSLPYRNRTFMLINPDIQQGCYIPF